MNPDQTSEAAVEVATRLMLAEAADQGDATERAAAAGRVCVRLVQVLAPILGDAGVRALFARSAQLNKVESPCFEDLLTALTDESASVSPSLDLCLGKLDPAGVTEVATRLYATLYALLTTFLGERLVLTILMQEFAGLDENESQETE